MHLRELLALGLVCLFAGLATAKDRTWTSSDGRTMEGEFVRELDGDVTFLVKGKLVTIALDKLSERDRQIVRDLAAGKQVSDEPVPAATATGGSTPAAQKPAADDPFAPVPDRPDEPAETSISPTKKKQKGPESRVWTDIFGRKATGKFIRIFGSNVVVSRAGAPLTIDFFQLSDADQTYVRELLTSRGEEDLIPVKPPPMREGAGGDARQSGGDPGDSGSPSEGPATGTTPVGPGIGGPGIGGPGIGGPGIGGPGIDGPGIGGPGIGGPGFGPRGPRGRSGMGGPGISGPPGSGIGPGSGLGDSFPRGPRGPSGFGPSGFGPSGFGPGSTSTDTTTISPTPQPYNPPQPYSPPTPNYGSSAGSFAQDQAERDRRNADQMQSRIDQAAQSTANMFQRVPVCSNCRKQVTEEESKRSTCPHCGARWVFNQYNPSATSRTTSSSPLASLSGSANQRAVRTALIVGGAIVVVIVLCGGAIAVAMALASASRPAQRYRI